MTFWEDAGYQGWVVVEAEQDPAKANPLGVRDGKQENTLPSIQDCKKEKEERKEYGKESKKSDCWARDVSGKLHGTNVQNFIPEAEISVVADPFMNDSMKEWAESVGIRKTSSNPEDVFADPEVGRGVYLLLH